MTMVAAAYQSSEPVKIMRRPNLLATKSEQQCADKKAGEGGGYKAGKTVEAEEVRGRGGEKPAADESPTDAGGEEKIVKLEAAAERQQHHQAPDVASGGSRSSLAPMNAASCAGAAVAGGAMSCCSGTNFTTRGPGRLARLGAWIRRHAGRAPVSGARAAAGALGARFTFAPTWRSCTSVGAWKKVNPGRFFQAGGHLKRSRLQRDVVDSGDHGLVFLFSLAISREVPQVGAGREDHVDAGHGGDLWVATPIGVSIMITTTILSFAV